MYLSPLRMCVFTRGAYSEGLSIYYLIVIDVLQFTESNSS